jgi:hypothetical protein
MFSKIIFTIIGVIILWSILSSTNTVIKLRTLKDGKLVVEQFCDSSPPLYKFSTALAKEHLRCYFTKRDYLFYVSYRYYIQLDKDLLLHIPSNFELRLFIPGVTSNSNAAEEDGIYKWSLISQFNTPYLYHATHKWRLWVIIPTFVAVLYLILWKRTKKIH